MDLVRQFQVLGSKQLAFQEGISMMRRAQLELARSRAAADKWGVVAVMANVTIIPLNCIVNGLELKGANTLYKTLVKQLYGKFGASGTRVDGAAKTGLANLKKIVVSELKRKALTEFIPGVNILVGLAEDSMAAWQVVQLVEGGSREMTAQARSIERQISQATSELVRLGVRRAEVLEQLQRIARTA